MLVGLPSFLTHRKPAGNRAWERGYIKIFLPGNTIMIFTFQCFDSNNACITFEHLLPISAGTEPGTDIAERVMPGSLSSEEVASVILPNSLFQRITNTTDNIGLTFGFYNEIVLFPVGEVSAESKSIEGRQTRVGSLIASAIVGVNKNFQNLQDPVLNTFQLQIPPEMV